MKSFCFQWHVSEKCNLRCRHCYQQSSTGGNDDAFDTITTIADNIFNGLGDRQISINLTGGEPLIYRDLFQLTDYLQRFPNLNEINIITNGTKLDKAAVTELGRTPKIGTLKVSLEAPVARINDEIRGRGNFDLVRNNLGCAVENSSKPIVLMTTLSRQNIHLIPQTVEFAVEMGLSGVIFERFVPLGRGKKMANQLVNPTLWKQAVRSILKASELEAEIDDLLAYKAYWLTLENGKVVHLEGARCNLGDESMALMPGGHVYPCRRLPIELGCVLTDPLTDIIASLSLFAPDQVKSRLRGRICPSCEVAHCAGCRAIASAIMGDPYADDPSCDGLFDKNR